MQFRQQCLAVIFEQSEMVVIEIIEPKIQDAKEHEV